MLKIDQTDKKIMELLQGNCRLTIKEIAAELGLTNTPVFERIRRLERHGIIDKYVALLNADKIGKKLTVYLNLSLTDHTKNGLDNFEKLVRTYVEVLECYHITGEADFLLKVVVEDIERYNDFIVNKLSVMPNISRVKSQFVLSTRKHTTAHSLDP